MTGIKEMLIKIFNQLKSKIGVILVIILSWITVPFLICNFAFLLILFALCFIFRRKIKLGIILLLFSPYVILPIIFITKGWDLYFSTPRLVNETSLYKNKGDPIGCGMSTSLQILCLVPYYSTFKILTRVFGKRGIINEKIKEKPLNAFKIGDFLAKLINSEKPTYVKVEKLTFVYDAKKYEFLIKELDERKPQIRDIINIFLISSTPEIATREGKEAFEKEILKEANKILCNGQIEEVYCEIIVQ